MKVNLQKKKAVAAAMLLTMCCYGQAWAEEIDLGNNLGGVINLGDDTGVIKTDKLTVGGTKLSGKEIDIRAREIDNYFQDQSTTLDINANKVTLKSDVEISDSHYSQDIEIFIRDVDININQGENYKKAITQINAGIVGSSKLNINFYGSESYFKGDLSGNIKGTLAFDQGAKFIIDSQYMTSFADNLKLLNGSILEFRNAVDGDYVKALNILGDFDGSDGIIKMRVLGNAVDNNFKAGGDYVYVKGQHTGDTKIVLSGYNGNQNIPVGGVLVRVKDEQGKFYVQDVEGALSWDKYKLEAKDVIFENDGSYGELYVSGKYTDWYIADFSHETAPTTSTKTLLSTITAGYDTWRNDTDKFNERMGELRMNGAGTDGVWVRTKGSEFGRHSSNGSYTNKQQTYQLGYDAVTSKDDKQTTYTGVAAEYGKGSLSFDSGTGTMKSLGLGVYQSQLRESGHYLDLTYRFDKYKNDFHVADSMGNPISGKYGNNAMSLSAEYGRKNALKHGWYVEPQSEVTLGYMFGNDFTTSNNIRVEQKNMPALIGRLGLNIGREVSDKVNFYVKASVNHDFLGNYDMHMTDMSTGERLNASDKFGSSWFDYGAGVSVKTGKDSYAYFDIERAVGGEYKKNWDWNAGVRWSF